MRSYPKTVVLITFVGDISTRVKKIQHAANLIYWGEFLEEVAKNFSLLCQFGSKIKIAKKKNCDKTLYKIPTVDLCRKQLQKPDSKNKTIKKNDKNGPHAKATANVLVEPFFECFWHVKFLTQTDHFAKAIAFACARPLAIWPIFKISFLEYLVFFRAVFLHRTTLMFF